MNINFASCLPAALMLNGVFAGRLNGFEKSVNIDLRENIFAEVCPAGKLPVGFFINDGLISSPPAGMDIYLLGGGEALFSLHSFKSADMRLKINFQTRFCENLVTIFSQGGTYLAVEGQKYFFCEAGDSFVNACAEEKTLAGYPVLAIRGENKLIIISHTGRQIFANEVESAEFGETLKAELPLKTCQNSVAKCEYAYNGEELQLLSSEITDRATAQNSIHIAFFETLLYGGDCKKYLSESLLPHAANLREYLGNYTAVLLPSAGFCKKYPGVPAAGLCYPVKSNLFNVKYFAAELKNGKINNLYPVERS